MVQVNKNCFVNHMDVFDFGRENDIAATVELSMV
jgi:hypothetical protein